MLTHLSATARRVRRRVLAHRRLLAFLLTLAAAGIALQVVRPDPPQHATMAVAAHDLAAGTVLTAADLATVRTGPDGVPDDVVRQPVGQRLAAPVRRGEPVTDVRVVGPDLTAGHPGLVAVPVRMTDAEMAGLLRIGDVVDLYVTDAATGRTEPVTTDTLILSLPQSDGPSRNPSPGGKTQGVDVAGAPTGRLVIVGVPASSVEAVTSAGVGGYLTFAY